VRDLLVASRTDFAILNSDVLSYPDIRHLASRRPARKSAWWLHSCTKEVLLFAKRGIKGLDGLRGRKIGVPAKLPPARSRKDHLGLLKINAEVLPVDSKDRGETSSKTPTPSCLYEKDLASLQALGITPATHRLLPIPASGPLAGTTPPGKLGNDALPGLRCRGAETGAGDRTPARAFDWSPEAGAATPTP